jgi:hypothetical protein
MLYLLLFEKKNKEKEKKEKGRNSQGTFSQGRYALVAVSYWDFPGC